MSKEQATLSPFEQAVADRVEARKARKKQAQLDLLDNEAFMEAQAHISAKSADIRHLNSIIGMLNEITPFVANNGTKFNIRVFPVDQATFSSGYSQLIGIIKGIDGAFTDEMQLSYSAVTGLDIVELQEASLALGRTAYCNKAGVVVEGEAPNYDMLAPLLESIIMKLDLVELEASHITKSMVELWHTKALLKANNQAKSMAEAEALSTEKFTLES